MGLIFAHQKDANAGKGETEEVKVPVLQDAVEDQKVFS